MGTPHTPNTTSHLPALSMVGVHWTLPERPGATVTDSRKGILLPSGRRKVAPAPKVCSTLPVLVKVKPIVTLSPTVTPLGVTVWRSIRAEIVGAGLATFMRFWLGEGSLSNSLVLASFHTPNCSQYSPTVFSVGVQRKLPCTPLAR
ncbi:MAG: hypothetical protein DDT33_01182 [Firmicutes bacterium]|nr:hypothetical protein [Bacillota bacterium]